jgi:integrase
VASIDKVGPKKYRARWRAPDGASRSRTFDRRVDAERHLTQVEGDKLRGAYVDPSAGRITVADYWVKWSERQSWRATTRMSTTSLFTCHVLPALGRRPLNGLRRGDIESRAARLPLSARTANQAAQYLSAMLEGAVADGLIAQNPAHRAKRRRVDVHPIVPLNQEEALALRQAAPGPFRVALTLGLGVGLRQSEATGLTVDRIDFLRRQVTVDRQLVSPKAGPCSLGPPKSPRSYRTVPLADAVLEELAAHLAEYGCGSEGLVLCCEDGRPIRRQRFGVIWRQVRQRADLPNARFHDTRHTFASTLLSGGVSVAAAADYVGHTAAELLRTYAHLLPSDHDRARAVVQTAFAWDRVTLVSQAAAVEGE